MLSDAVDDLGWDRSTVRVIDLAAGNGISGEALRAHGLHPVLGTDIVPEARVAALRDRPAVYDGYQILDLLNLQPAQERALAELQANALSCVAPVGTAGPQLPPLALTAVAKRLAADAVIAYMHDPTLGVPDEVTAELWARELGPRDERRAVGRAALPAPLHARPARPTRWSEWCGGGCGARPSSRPDRAAPAAVPPE